MTIDRPSEVNLCELNLYDCDEKLVFTKGLKLAVAK